MTEEDGKIANLMLDTSWKSLDYTQQRIDKLDDKANNIMAFSGVLMTLDIAIIIGISNMIVSVLLFIELLLLFKCVYLAFETINLKEQKILDAIDTFNKIERIDHIKDTGDISITIGSIQKELLKKAQQKSTQLKKSMTWFNYALGYLIILAFLFISGYFVNDFLSSTQICEFIFTNFNCSY